jgi:hypothetical protein
MGARFRFSPVGRSPEGGKGDACNAAPAFRFSRDEGGDPKSDRVNDVKY